MVLGLGMGCLMQMVSLIAQNSVELKDMGVATSARMFFQQMGGSLGVAAFGAIFANRLTSAMSSLSGGRQGARQRRVARPVAGDAACRPRSGGVFRAASRRRCTRCSSGPSRPRCVVFVLALFIKEVPLRGRAAPERGGGPAPEAEALIG